MNPRKPWSAAASPNVAGIKRTPGAIHAPSLERQLMRDEDPDYGVMYFILSPGSYLQYAFSEH
jgi:hypothetical protein